MERGNNQQRSASNVTRALYVLEELKDIELFRSFWRRLPAHSAVALRAPKKAKEETLMLKISKELIYRINEFFWTEIDFDVAEMVCTACGCLAFRGATLRSKTSNDYARLRRWKRHWYLTQLVKGRRLFVGNWIWLPHGLWSWCICPTLAQTLS